MRRDDLVDCSQGKLISNAAMSDVLGHALLYSTVYMYSTRASMQAPVPTRARMTSAHGPRCATPNRERPSDCVCRKQSRPPAKLLPHYDRLSLCFLASTMTSRPVASEYARDAASQAAAASSSALPARPTIAPPVAGIAPGTSFSPDLHEELVYLDRASNTWRCEAGEENARQGVLELEWRAGVHVPGAETAQDEEGNEIRRKEAGGRWVPVLDEDVVKRQQMAYGVAGVDENVSGMLRRPLQI